MEFEKGSNAKLENFRGKGRIEKNGKVDSFRCVGEKLKKKKQGESRALSVRGALEKETAKRSRA